MPRKRTRTAIPILFGVLAAASAHASKGGQAEPRFGDSTWVAPNVVIQGSVTDPGPRVAKRDGERPWETMLRTPFRVAFFPVRLVARGVEALGPIAERVAPP